MISKAAAEHAVREAVDRAKTKKLSPELDSRFELKSTWMNPATLAVRIAGLANAARGEDVFLVVGAHEDGRIEGASTAELADLIPKIQKFFDDPAPSLACHFTLDIDDKSVVVLAFDTTGAPFVVNFDAAVAAGAPKTSPCFVVPWREGSSRIARRRDLIRLLVPKTREPMVEIDEVELVVMNDESGRYDFFDYMLKVAAYVIPVAPVWLLSRRASVRLDAKGTTYDSQSVHFPGFMGAQTRVDQPGSLNFEAHFRSQDQLIVPRPIGGELQISGSLPTSDHGGARASFSETLLRVELGGDANHEVNVFRAADAPIAHPYPSFR